MSRRPSLLLALLALLALFAAACGDDADGAADGSPVTGADTSTGGDEGDNGGGGTVPSEITDALGECGFLTGFFEASVGLEGFEPAPGEPIDFGELYTPLADGFQQVADDAPAEIADAFDVVAAAFAELVEALDGIVLDPANMMNMSPEDMERLESLDGLLDTDAIDAASSDIEAWLEDNCSELSDGFDLSDAFGPVR